MDSRHYLIDKKASTLCSGNCTLDDVRCLTKKLTFHLSAIALLGAVPMIK